MGLACDGGTDQLAGSVKQARSGTVTTKTVLKTDKYKQQIAEALLAGVLRYQQTLKRFRPSPRAGPDSILGRPLEAVDD